MSNYYDIVKALHIISFISWMVGFLYLPRLFVYHCETVFGNDDYKRFCVMETRLQKYIMNIAMFFTISTGLILSYIYGFSVLGVWFHIKCVFVILLLIFNIFLYRCRVNFQSNNNKYSAKFFRFINEIPTILMIFIVFLVILKPFD